MYVLQAAVRQALLYKEVLCLEKLYKLYGKKSCLRAVTME